MPFPNLTDNFETSRDVESFMGFVGSKNDVLNNLSKAGNESIIGTNASVTNQAQSAEEKKKREAHEAYIQRALEQQRQEMIERLDAQINDLRNQIEQDQKHLKALQDKQHALKEIDQILLAGTLDHNNPDHLALLDKAGIEDKEAFLNMTPEEQRSFVNGKEKAINEEIKGLVTRIEENMDKLDALTNAKQALKDGADPEQIRKDLEEQGITLEVEDGKLDKAIALEIHDTIRDNKAATKEYKSLSLDDKDEFVTQAEQSGKLDEDDLQKYKENLENEKQQIAELNTPGL